MSRFFIVVKGRIHATRPFEKWAFNETFGSDCTAARMVCLYTADAALDDPAGCNATDRYASEKTLLGAWPDGEARSFSGGNEVVVLAREVYGLIIPRHAWEEDACVFRTHRSDFTNLPSRHAWLLDSREDIVREDGQPAGF